MTYQSPYQPPQGNYSNFNYYQHGPDVLGPARRAGILLYVIGTITLLSSLCCGGTGALIPQIMAQQPQAFSEMQQQMPELTPQMFQIGFLILGGVCFIAGIIFIVLGYFVRSGSKGAVITAMVLSILGLLFLLMNLVSTLVTGRGDPSRVASGVCVLAIPTALLALLVVWLISALKSTDAAAQQRYAMQYWQYAQQQQAYGQQQSTYTQPPPPPTSPPPGDSSGPPAQG